VARGIAALRAEPVPDRAMQQTLALLNIGSVTSEARSAVTGGKRSAMSVALAVVVMLLLWAGLTSSRTPEMRALAKTMTALERVRSIHWTGVSRVKESMARGETWFSEGRSRSEQGDRITVDDGETRRTYTKGTDFVLVDRSSLRNRRETPTPFQPDGLLSSLERFRRAIDSKLRVEELRATGEDGRPLQRFEIYISHRGSEEKLVWLIDRETRLPVKTEQYDKMQGDWQLRNRVDRIEYNLPIPEERFRLSLPPDVRAIDVDRSKRARARLAVRRLPGGGQVILHATDMTQRGDVLLSLSAVGADGYPMDTIGIALEKLTDERATSYVRTSPNIFEHAYRVFWMVPLKPPAPGDPHPRRLTFSVLLGTGERAVFRDLAAPPPFETLKEVPPFCDWHDGEPEFEQHRRRARIAQRGHRSPHR
jgi:hypothetical protein